MRQMIDSQKNEHDIWMSSQFLLEFLYLRIWRLGHLNQSQNSILWGLNEISTLRPPRPMRFLGHIVKPTLAPQAIYSPSREFTLWPLIFKMVSERLLFENKIQTSVFLLGGNCGHLGKQKINHSKMQLTLDHFCKPAPYKYVTAIRSPRPYGQY